MTARPLPNETQQATDDWLIACDEAIERGEGGLVSDPDGTNGQLEPLSSQMEACLQLLELDRLCISTADASNSNSPARSETKLRFQRFEIIRRLGQGGFGIVFLARDPVLDRLVALKIPLPEALASTSKRDRFLSESRYMAQLNHPHLLAIYEAGQVGPMCYQVYQYCEAGSLADQLNRWPRRQTAWPSAIDLIVAISSGLDDMHQSSILHCDLKPSNILLVAAKSPDDPGAISLTPYETCDQHTEQQAGPIPNDYEVWFHPRLGDFGLARRIQEDEHNESGHSVSDAATHSVLRKNTIPMGSLPYMAPEQLDRRVAPLSPQTDLFGIGAVLFELLAGQPPFQATVTRDPDSWMTLLQSERSDLPPELIKILQGALHPDPASRYASVTDFANQLTRLRRSQYLQASSSTTILPPQRIPRRTMLTMAIGFGLMVSGFVATGQLWRHSEDWWPFQAATAASSISDHEGVELLPGRDVYHTNWSYSLDQTWTIEAWYRPQGPSGFLFSIAGLLSFNAGQGPGRAGPNLSVSTGESEVFILHAQRAQSVNAWHHVAVTFDQGHFQIFLDGVRCQLAVYYESDQGIELVEELPSMKLEPVWPNLGLTIGSNDRGSSPRHRYPFTGRIRTLRISKSVRYSKSFKTEAHLMSDPETIALYHFHENTTGLADERIVEESGHSSPLIRVPANRVDGE